MANIKVQDLISIAGIDLFSDSESFIRDLSDLEVDLQGGLLFRTNPVIVRGTPARIDPKDLFLAGI